DRAPRRGRRQALVGARCTRDRAPPRGRAGGPLLAGCPRPGAPAAVLRRVGHALRGPRRRPGADEGAAREGARDRDGTGRHAALPVLTWHRTRLDVDAKRVVVEVDGKRVLEAPVPAGYAVLGGRVGIGVNEDVATFRALEVAPR